MISFTLWPLYLGGNFALLIEYEAEGTECLSEYGSKEENVYPSRNQLQVVQVIAGRFPTGRAVPDMSRPLRC
jgi:hypothetical protein